MLCRLCDLGGRECFQDARKSNLTAKCLNTFVAHCSSRAYNICFNHARCVDVFLEDENAYNTAWAFHGSEIRVARLAIGYLGFTTSETVKNSLRRIKAYMEGLLCYPSSSIRIISYNSITLEIFAFLCVNSQQESVMFDTSEIQQYTNEFSNAPKEYVLQMTKYH